MHSLGEPPLSLIAAGDLMLGARARRVIAENGADYAFESVRPLFQRSRAGLANLEGPFAAKARKVQRRHSYRVHPSLAPALLGAGIDVVTIANNHLLDCGRAGVAETLDTLASARIGVIGGGRDRAAAHLPLIRQVDGRRIGMLGYYWNSRCAATATLPGSAMDTFDALDRDIRLLRDRVDRVVITFHWGVPYVREPAAEERAKARFAIDCGADVVIGHHQHIIQPFEIYRGRPIFYGIGNFAFGSGNSHAEGMLVGIRFEDTRTRVYVYPLYVKNRDPRVCYQPKVLSNEGAARLLSRLARISGSSGPELAISAGRGILDLPHQVSR